MLQSTAAYRDDAADRKRRRMTQAHRTQLRRGLMVGGVLAVIIAEGAYWLNGERWVDTDDAYVQADSMTLPTDVSGIVASIPVHEGEAVSKGQVLFTLDPLKFQIALDNARANLAQTRLDIEAAKADYQTTLRDTAARQQQVNSDQATYDRYQALVKQHAVDNTRAEEKRRWRRRSSRGYRLRRCLIAASSQPFRHGARRRTTHVLLSRTHAKT